MRTDRDRNIEFSTSGNRWALVPAVMAFFFSVLSLYLTLGGVLDFGNARNSALQLFAFTLGVISYLLLLLLTSLILKGLLLHLVNSSESSLIVVDPMRDLVHRIPHSIINTLESDSILYPRVGRVQRLSVHYFGTSQIRSRNPIRISFLGKRNLANLGSYLSAKFGSTWFYSFDKEDVATFSVGPKNPDSNLTIESSMYFKAVLIDVLLILMSVIGASGLLSV